MYCETSVSIRWPPHVDDPGERQQRDLGPERLAVDVSDENDRVLRGDREQRVGDVGGSENGGDREVDPLAVGGNGHP